jgi:ABC-type sugar transport system substrate-binding protein
MMKLSKKTLIPVAGASVLLACATGAAVAQSKIPIGFSQGTMESSWRVNMVEGNRRYAEKNLPDVDLIVTNGENNASKQVSDVESLMARGVKVLIISPVTAEALTPVVKQAMTAGIPVVTLDRKVNTDVTLHIGADNKLIGETAGRYVCKVLNGQRDRDPGDRRRFGDDRPARPLRRRPVEGMPGREGGGEPGGQLHPRARIEVHGRHAAAVQARRDPTRLRA